MATEHLDEAMEHVRKRPGMYIGSTGPRGVNHLLYEVIGNAFDEVLAGRGQTIDVMLRADGSVVIADDGPGLGAGRADQQAFLTAMFTSVRFEPTADGHHPHVHLSEPGWGLGIVSALTRRLEVEVRSPSMTLHQSFVRGVAEGPLTREIERNEHSGTTVRLWPDPEIFQPSASVQVAGLHDRLTELSRLEPRVRFRFGVEPVDLEPAPDLTTMWRVQYPGVAAPEGPAVLTGRDGIDEVQIAVDFGGWQTEVKGFCNYREVLEGTALLDGVTHGIERIFNPDAAGSVLGHIRAVIHIKLLDPRWGGPTKSRIDDPRAVALIAGTIGADLPAALNHRPDLQEQIDECTRRNDLRNG